MVASRPRMLATAGLAVALGWCAYVALLFQRQRAELERVTVAVAQRTATLRQIRAASAAVTARAAATVAAPPVDSAQTTAAAELAQAAYGWLQRSRRLRELAAQRADLGFPEIEVLSEAEWFSAAREAKLDSEEDIRATLRSLRDTARNSLAGVLQAALTKYADANDGRLPIRAADLAAFTSGRASAALLAGYDVQQQGELLGAPLDVPILAERAGSADPDHRLVVTSREAGVEDLNAVPDRELRRALRAYRAANGGTDPVEASQLVNYFPAPLRPAALRAFLDRPSSDFSAEALRKLLPPD